MIFHYKISRPRPATLLKEKNSKKNRTTGWTGFFFFETFLKATFLQNTFYATALLVLLNHFCNFSLFVK